MCYTKKKNRMQSIVITFILLFLPIVAQGGFGVSPPSIQEDMLVPGASVERTVYLVRNNAQTILPVEINVESKRIKDWISFNTDLQFDIPKGVQQFPLPIKIQVPQNAELGIYRAFIRVHTKPDAATSKGEVAISVGGRIDVTLKVGDKVFEQFEIKRIDLNDVTVGSNPKVSFVVANTGNVETAPDSVSFELFNKHGNVRLGYSEIENLEPVPPFSEKKFNVEFPSEVTLAQGEYWGDVKIYNKDGEVVRQLKTIFNVTEQRFMALSLNAKSALSITGIIVLVSVAVLFFIVKFRRRKNSRFLH